MDRRKMSKSLGNVVDPVKQLQRWGTDPLRYFLMAEAGAMADDKAFSNERVLVRNRELTAKVGNTYHRTRRFGISRSVQDVLVHKRVPLEPGDELAPGMPRLLDLTHELPALVWSAMERHDTPVALKYIIDTLTACNVVYDGVAPWNRDPADPAVVRTVATVAETIRVTAILLQPFMPAKMATLLDYLGVAPEDRGWDFARVGADLSYCMSSTADTAWPLLFPRTRENSSWERIVQSEAPAPGEANDAAGDPANWLGIGPWR
jgi:methionyl-tRNA synthetase